MKKKYLFGMLLSGALLAACTAEDDLKAPVAQRVNPDAPVFAVSMENDGDLQNRADFVKGDSWKVKFEGEDLLSLYHGATSGLYNWQNAIYKGTEDEETGALIFTTQAMVNSGYAVMVYPADTEFEQPGYTNTYQDGHNEYDEDTDTWTWVPDVDEDGTPVLTDHESNQGVYRPVVSVPAVQDKDTKKFTPYVSEVLEMKRNPGDDDPQAAAGYAKPYDIVMRRAAGALSLKLKTSNVPEVEGIEPLKVTAVKLKASNNAYTTEGYVKNTLLASNAKYKDYPSWMGTTDIYFRDAKPSITTTDIEDNNNATFTLLPKYYIVQNGVVEVHTNYGVVYINNTDASGSAVRPWDGETLKNYNVTDGLNTVYAAMYGDASTGLFKGKKVGKHVTATIKVDYANLKLNNMHIKTSDELKTVLKVYDAGITEETNVNLILDGNNKGLFTMDYDAWNAVVAHLSKVTFTPCTDPGEACTTIKLEAGSSETEVPTLVFTSNSVEVQLSGAWKFTNVTNIDDPTKAGYKKTLTNVTTLNVLSGSTLKLQNQIASANTNLKIVNNGTINVSGNVYVRHDLTNNYGATINIPAQGDRLLMAEAKTLVNNPAKASKGIDAFTDGAVINNGGTLAIVDGSNSVINNYGTINQTNGDARTLITSNAKLNATHLSAFATNNDNLRIGTINLLEPTGGKDNVQITNASKTEDGVRKFDPTHQQAGFIKIKVSDTDAATAKFGDLANYAILEGACAGVKVAQDKDGNDTNLPANIKYIDVRSSKEVVFTGTFNLNALIVKGGYSANIPRSSSVTVGYVDAEGTITKAGTFTYGSLEGYFGAGKADNILAY